LKAEVGLYLIHPLVHQHLARFVCFIFVLLKRGSKLASGTLCIW
jgi:hypothetical protein